MNQVYVVWEFVPESTRIYHLILSNEELERAQQCHGHFVNLCDTPPNVKEHLQWLNEYLENREDCLVYDSEERTSPIEMQEAATLIVTGWVD